jgi:hypothetical protein
MSLDPIISRHMNAFNPYMRMLRGVEAETEETRELSALFTNGDGEQAEINRARIQAFIDRENS